MFKATATATQLNCPSIPVYQLPTIPTSSPQVTLHDCLACSGCVTSAETVLLETQSTEELVRKLDEAAAPEDLIDQGGASATVPPKRPVIVVSVSAQSRAALSAFYGLGPTETLARLSAWLRGRGVAAVLDVCDGRDLALIETATEFVQRYAWRSGGLEKYGVG